MAAPAAATADAAAAAAAAAVASFSSSLRTLRVKHSTSIREEANRKESADEASRVSVVGAHAVRKSPINGEPTEKNVERLFGRVIFIRSKKTAGAKSLHKRTEESKLRPAQRVLFEEEIQVIVPTRRHLPLQRQISRTQLEQSGRSRPGLPGAAQHPCP